LTLGTAPAVAPTAPLGRAGFHRPPSVPGMKVGGSWNQQLSRLAARPAGRGPSLGKTIPSRDPEDCRPGGRRRAGPGGRVGRVRGYVSPPGGGPEGWRGRKVLLPQPHHPSLGLFSTQLPWGEKNRLAGGRLDPRGPPRQRRRTPGVPRPSWLPGVPVPWAPAQKQEGRGTPWPEGGERYPLPCPSKESRSLGGLRPAWLSWPMVSEGCGSGWFISGGPP